MAAPGEVTFEQELSAKRRVIRKDGVDCHNECEMLSIVIEKAPGSSCSMSSYEKLWNRMNDSIRDETTKRRLIHTVPEMLRQKESCKGCFDPMVVSIGPYHHGKGGLQDMERVKYSLTRNFVKNREEQLRTLYAGVQQIYADARGYYPEETVSRFDANAFTTLMLVDGCFVLQFIDDYMNNHEVQHMNSNIAAFVRRDLMLLENQLPYMVLEKLMVVQGNDGDKLIDKFIESIRGVSQLPRRSYIRATAEFYDKCFTKLKDLSSKFGKGKANQTDLRQPAEEPNNQVRPLHLLDIFLREYINAKDLRKESLKNIDHWHSYPPAKELRTLGIHFGPSIGKKFTDIKFISTLTAGLLLLPQIMIDDTTKSMLLNLVAYETSPDAPDDRCGLTSYICFMDSLIDQAEDVKELRSDGVVFSVLGSDQQAAELFNDIARDLVLNSSAFAVTKKGIEAHSRSNMKTWMAQFINTHFRSPWTVIAFLAATAAIFLTFLGSYISVKGHCSGEGRKDDASFCVFF